MKKGEKYRISVTGDLGSGKTTVCRYLKEQFGINVYSIGIIQRKLAQKYNMSTYEFNKYMESHPEIDEEIDSTLVSIGKLDEHMVLDSRMAWHFVPDSFKVYLAVDIDTAAARIMSDSRGSVESYDSLEEARNKILERKMSENLRYKTKYGVDCSDPGNYDLIIDTSGMAPLEVARAIMSGLKSKTDNGEC